MYKIKTLEIVLDIKNLCWIGRLCI